MNLDDVTTPDPFKDREPDKHGRYKVGAKLPPEVFKPLIRERLAGADEGRTYSDILTEALADRYDLDEETTQKALDRQPNQGGRPR